MRNLTRQSPPRSPLLSGALRRWRRPLIGQSPPAARLCGRVPVILTIQSKCAELLSLLNLLASKISDSFGLNMMRVQRWARLAKHCLDAASSSRSLHLSRSSLHGDFEWQDPKSPDEVSFPPLSNASMSPPFPCNACTSQPDDRMSHLVSIYPRTLLPTAQSTSCEGWLGRW